MVNARTRTVIGVLLSAAIAVVAMLAVDHSVRAQAAGGGRQGSAEVVLMRCNTGGPGFAVAAFQGSAAAPGKKADACAEELSLLIRDGFAIRDIGHYFYDKDYFVVYTLMK